MTDIQIAQKCKMETIDKIAQKASIDDKYLEMYGKYKAKINNNLLKDKENERDGKLILVTAITPTPAGEGKTTTSIGLLDSLNAFGKKAIAALREPSLGPVFGLKGGATGGGYAQVVPMEDINLHFTGDFHAISSACNLLASMIDNHLQQGNDLNIDPRRIIFKRVVDMNDRALRDVGLVERQDHFNITSASEIMSILCLSENFMDLKKRLAHILLGYNMDGKPIYSKDLKLEGSLALLLKDAIKPNLVQSLEHHPVIIHGGPFANIAHGCNSIIATKLGMKLADYVVTEAGFGSDLGAEKFFDIKCRTATLKPDCVVIVATIKALKYHAGIEKEDILLENLEAVKKGLSNLKVHIENMKLYTSHVIVTLNQYDTDTNNEIEVVKKFVNEQHLPFAVNQCYQHGGEGTLQLANEVIQCCELPNDFHLLYSDNMSLLDKIEIICKKIYRANKVCYQEGIYSKIREYEQMGYSKFPICIAKTHASISDDPKKLGAPCCYDVTVRNVNIYAGAGFIVVYLGNIMTMPGLSRHPNYEQIDIDDHYQIKGLF